MAMSQEQLAGLLGHVLSEQRACMLQALEAMVGKTAQKERTSDRLFAKHFRVDRFDGNREKWEEWSFTFMHNVRSLSRTAYDLLK